MTGGAAAGWLPTVTLSYDEAAARITAPGERFETGEVEVRGVTYTAFTVVPGTMRDLFKSPPPKKLPQRVMETGKS